MTAVIVGVFLATYAGMALGRVPGLKIDRTGIALMAVAVLLAAGALDLGAVGRAIDVPTLVLLFALMILSAQFAIAGFYDRCAAVITGAEASPKALLALTVAIAGGLSAVLANDVVVFAMTPLLCAGIRGRGLDARPFLIGLAGASNAGSAATVIGNPQNILIGQLGGLDFWKFLYVCGIPALIALGIVYAVVAIVWRDSLARAAPAPAAPAPVAVHRWQVGKGILATLLLIGMFATPLPREIGALAIAAALLASRTLASREMIGAVDWHLLLLFACLFSVTAAFAGTGIAADGLAWLAARGFLPETLAILAPLALVLGNTIGNVPAVILLMAVWPSPGEGALYGLALLSTLAGNFLLVGSMANLIVAERAAAAGVALSFRDFARAGIPMTLASMAVAVVWLGVLGWMPWR
ncbi:MAG: anion transporter [Rhodospirillales bacterium]|nr:anion transporter [Rhodospirillales bacterium]